MDEDGCNGVSRFFTIYMINNNIIYLKEYILRFCRLIEKKNDIVAFPPVFLNRIILKVNYFE